MTTDKTKPAVTEACIKCNQQYNIRQKADVSAKLLKETPTKMPVYPHICLSCTQKALMQYRDTYVTDLNHAVRAHKIAQQTYRKAAATKQFLETRHSTADQQQNYIKFFLQQCAEKAKPISPAKPRKPRKPSKSRIKQASVIETLLASLTPEQQALVAKQAATM